MAYFFKDTCNISSLVLASVSEGSFFLLNFVVLLYIRNHTVNVLYCMFSV